MFLLRHKESNLYHGWMDSGVDRKERDFSLFALKFESEDDAKDFAERHYPGVAIVEKASAPFIGAVERKHRRIGFIPAGDELPEGVEVDVEAFGFDYRNYKAS